MTQISTAMFEPEIAGYAHPRDSVEFFARAIGALGHVEPGELEQYRTQLMRYAQWLLGSREAAQDAVQDTMLAALHAPSRFCGRSSVRTWLFGILKHKVMDTFRRQAREVPLEDDSDEDPARNDEQFSADGRWRERPSNWGDPEQTLNQKRFFEALERCIDRLPKNAARVFTMREILGMETDEICATVGITHENCFVILHRARLTLRNLLERDWSAAQLGSRRAASSDCSIQ
jgi:RNA polymerase sigma-70 factor (ECF subfamily)